MRKFLFGKLSSNRQRTEGWANNHGSRSERAPLRDVVSRSSKETRKFAEKLAKSLALSAKRRNALIFALEGELGSGKTTFVQGFLRGMGIKRRSPSPTFIIFRRFKIRNSKLGFSNLFHIDAYRIKHPRELLLLGLREILADPKNLVLIEWADRIKKILPRLRQGSGGQAEGTRWIRFRHGKKENERTLTI